MLQISQWRNKEMRELENERIRKWGNEKMRKFGNEKMGKWGGNFLEHQLCQNFKLWQSA